MIHTVVAVAKSRRFDVEKFVEFASTNKNAFIDDDTGTLVTNTWYCDQLIKDFIAAGNSRIQSSK